MRAPSDSSEPAPDERESIQRGLWFAAYSGAVILVMANAGCASTDPADARAFEAEVRAVVHEGMTMADADKALSARGFTCASGTVLEPHRTDARECVRSRSSLWPPYGCTQRVQLESRGAGG